MIRQAIEEDVHQLNALLDRNGFIGSFTTHHLQEFCLVGEIDGEIRGMIWAAISQSKFCAFIDYFTVDFAYKGLGVRLAKQGLDLLKKHGVKKIISVVEKAEDRQEAMKINRHFGLKPAHGLFYYCMGEVK